MRFYLQSGLAALVILLLFATIGYCIAQDPATSILCVMCGFTIHYFFHS